MELSPPAFKTFIVGTAYNLGIFIASASNTIETKIAERYPLKPTGYDYGKAICIFIAVVFAYVIIMMYLGPEKRIPIVASAPEDPSDLEENRDPLDPWKWENPSRKS